MQIAPKRAARLQWSCNDECARNARRKSGDIFRAKSDSCIVPRGGLSVEGHNCSNINSLELLRFRLLYRGNVPKSMHFPAERRHCARYLTVTPSHVLPLTHFEPLELRVI
jgi:hypothetical protein